MNSIRRCGMAVLAGGLLLVANGQRGGGRAGSAAMEDDPLSLPRPKDTELAHAKADREQNIKDAARVAELAEKVKADLSAASSFTLSLTTVKNVEEMTALSKKLQARLKSSYSRPDPAPFGYDASTPRPPGR